MAALGFPSAGAGGGGGVRGKEGKTGKKAGKEAGGAKKRKGGAADADGLELAGGDRGGDDEIEALFRRKQRA
jgi:hypothetical protein